ncbi:MAG: hypothetical protein PVI30_27270 [Myxococcales bacterium]|jgi:hypothetical protein
MRTSRVIPVALVLIASAVGWGLSLSGRRVRPARSADHEAVDAPAFAEPQATPVDAGTHRSAAVVRAAEPEPDEPAPAPRVQAQDEAPTPEPIAAEGAELEPDGPEDDGQDEEPLDPTDPRVVLRLPEHLRDASPAEQREYFEELERHHEGMMERARQQLKELDGDDPAALRLRQALEQAEAQLGLLQERLETL